MPFPNQLNNLRKERGLTQRALAGAVGIHVNQIKRYEAGTAQPTLETLVKLAEALKVSLDELVFGRNGSSSFVTHSVSGASNRKYEVLT